jgi:hypothetical protein
MGRLSLPERSTGGSRFSDFVLIDQAARKSVYYRRKDQSHIFANLHRLHLNRDQWDGTTKKSYNIQKSSCDILGDDYGRVVILRIPLSLYIPVLKRSDYV